MTDQQTTRVVHADAEDIVDLTDDVSEYYANVYSVRLSFADISIEFGRINIRAPLERRMSHRVLLAPITLKQLAKALVTSVESYEKTMGKIVIPEELEPTLSTVSEGTSSTTVSEESSSEESSNG